MTKVAVYKYYDKEKTLLYIGVSANPERLRKQHNTTLNWAKNIVRMNVKWYDTKELAQLAQIKAVKKYKPLHNNLANINYIAKRLAYHAKKGTYINCYNCDKRFKKKTYNNVFCNTICFHEYDRVRWKSKIRQIHN